MSSKQDEGAQLPESFWSRVRHALFGAPHNLQDPSLAHQISLGAFLAWIGLGADGLSSSAYGPDEAFRALGSNTYLAPLLVIATAFTVLIISFTYTKIIEHFPEGGGGYLVATKLLGNAAGLVSGSALLVDYILTITVSIAAGGDAIFSLLPAHFHSYKIPLEYGAIFYLTVMNLRGVKESVKMLIPIFFTFLITHIVLIGAGIFLNLGSAKGLVTSTTEGLGQGTQLVGSWGVFLFFLRAYSMGGGTYTGIEAVSNGLGVLKDPKVQTGKKTMLYMAISLAVTAGGLLLCYMLSGIQPESGQTLNATLAQRLIGEWRLGTIPLGKGFVWMTMFSEAILLFVAAQTGFIGGPRVMANMATDSWLPRRFASLSDRLTSQRGIILISLSAFATLLYSKGDVRVLVIMYSINVFITFSLAQLGMCLYWTKKRTERGPWIRNLLLHIVGFGLCTAILLLMIVEKIEEGGWITILVTSALITLCAVIRKHYQNVSQMVQEIDKAFQDIPMEPAQKGKPLVMKPNELTAVILVGGGHSRTGIHTLLTIFRLFPQTFHNVVFLSVGVINSDFFKGENNISEMEKKTQDALSYYVELAKGLGIPSQAVFRVGTDVVIEAANLCLEVTKSYPRSVIFGSELVFQEPRWYHRFLHNETAYAIQRQLRFAGISVVILPILLFNKTQSRTEELHEMMLYRGVSYRSEPH